MRRGVIVLFFMVLGVSTPAATQEQAPPLYELLPPGRDYPIARVCSTDQGICALPLTHPPGEPCSCRRADGVMVSGVCTH
jgi:hypothetical protein